MRGTGVKADGIRSAKTDSIWIRNVAEANIASPYIRLSGGGHVKRKLHSS
jgi:hypothetical protein